MAIEAPAPQAAARSTRVQAEVRSGEGRAERWAGWIVMYLAALILSLTVGASAWAFVLAG